MRAGKLDTRLRIERAQQGRTRKGEMVTLSWALVCEVWAGRRTTQAAERYTGAQLVAEADVAFQVRVWPGPQVIGPEERFRVVEGGENGAPYNVLGVMPMAQRGSGFMILGRGRAETTAAPEGPQD